MIGLVHSSHADEDLQIAAHHVTKWASPELCPIPLQSLSSILISVGDYGYYNLLVVSLDRFDKAIDIYCRYVEKKYLYCCPYSALKRC